MCRLLLAAVFLTVLVPHAFGAELQAEARWRPGSLALRFHAPPGEHIAEEVRASGWVKLDGSRLDLESDGALVARGLAFSLERGSQHQVEGQIRLAVCRDDGSACRPVSLAFAGQLDGRRGKKLLDEIVMESKKSDTVDPGTADPEAAFERARAAGKLVLLDFSTQWCPPCQLLSADVLHDPADSSHLEPFELVVLDADSPASFPWKDRYAVTGYPTSIVAAPDGEVIARMMGYDGEAAFLAWLDEAARAQAPVASLVASLDQVPAEDRGRVARRLFDEGFTEEAGVLIRQIPDEGERALLQFQIEPTLELLDLLASEEVDQIMEWIWKVVYELFQQEDIPEASRELVRRAIREALPRVAPEQAAELAYVLADLTPEDQDPEAIFALGAAIYRASFKGEPQLDRGRYTFLATLLSRASDSEAAISVMREAVAAFPGEFTYHFELASLLQDAGQLDAALESSTRAGEHAYGDMALRAGRQGAEVLVALGRKDEARRLLQSTLEHAQRPTEGQEVRTWRYLEFVEKALAELQDESSDAARAGTDGGP